MSFTAAPPGRLVPPAVGAGIIRRERLFQRLGARPTVVVVGTAGYGKSSLVSSWLDHLGPGVAAGWLTLGPNDQDAGRLATDILAALKTSSSGGLPSALTSLQAAPFLADPLALVDSIHEALYDSDVPLTLVLDDVQHLATSERAIAVLDHFLQWAPSTIRVVLAGRQVPRLRLQRLRLDDRLELIGRNDLAFTAAETAAAVSAAGVDMPTGSVDALHEVTQGWPAAVRMALLAVGAGAPADLALELRRDDALADYLTTEVLSSIDDELRAFVLGATIDELVCPALVDAVLGTDAAAVLLERCVALGLFLSREGVSPAGPWYRWHSLFAAHMRDRRRADDLPGSRRLEVRAAQWWSAVDPATAVGHALSGGDPERAGSIMASSWLDLVLAGRAETVVALVDSIPAEVSAAAELHLARALVAAQAGRADVSAVELATARGLADRLDDTTGFEVRASLIALFLVDDQAALADAVSSGRELLGRARDGSWGSDRSTLALVELYVGMGQVRQQQDLPAALVLLREAAESARRAGLTALELAAMAETCIPSIQEGDLEKSRQLAVDVLAGAQAKGWGQLPSVAPALGYLGWLSLWQGDARQARRHLEQTLTMLSPRDWGMRGLVLSTLAQACLLEGDVAEGEAVARQAHELAASGRMPRWWPSLLAALEATVALAKGDLTDAVRRASDTRPEPAYHLAECLRGNILLRGGRPQDCLDAVTGIPQEWRIPHVAVLIEVLSAGAFHALGLEEEAHSSLERGLAAAAPFRLVTPFLVAGSALVPLLAEHLARGTTHPEFVPPLLTRMSAPVTAAANEWGDTLTDRELTILRYLATNLSNAEIASAEYISLNTCKTHVARIYRKLNVSSRRAALRRAGDLGLI